MKPLASLSFSAFTGTLVQLTAAGSLAELSFEILYPSSCFDAATTTGSATTLTDLPQSTAGQENHELCPICKLNPSWYHDDGLPVASTTYTTVYTCPGDQGLETKTYTITEPCPTTGLDRGPDYVPSGFTVTKTQCTACPGSPYLYVTTPGPQATAYLGGQPIPASPLAQAADAAQGLPQGAGSGSNGPQSGGAVPISGQQSSPPGLGQASPANQAPANQQSAPGSSPDTGPSGQSQGGSGSSGNAVSSNNAQPQAFKGSSNQNCVKDSVGLWLIGAWFLCQII